MVYEPRKGKRGPYNVERNKKTTFLWDKKWDPIRDLLGIYSFLKKLEISKQNACEIVFKLENFTNSLSVNNIIVQIDVLEAAKSVFKFQTENLPITKGAKEMKKE